jgi:phosphoinositide-3-kinase regulatory subunit 4
VYLPDDNPAIFSIFFDASSRRTCYIAPERFQSSGDALFQTCTKLTPEMDIFSLGCTIAEIFLEGTALFTLSQLLRYRKNEYSPLDKLSQIKPEIREMIIEMIDLNPSKRHHTQYYLDKYNQIFIKDFKSCHDFIAIISDGDFGSSDTSFHVFMNQTTTPLVANIDARIEKMFKEFIDIMKICEIDIEDDLKYGVDSFPMFCDINGFTGRCDKIMNRGDDDLVLLFTTLVTSGIRNCLFPSSKLKALEMLMVFGIVLKDEYTLDRVIPFVVLMLSDSFDPVRMKALMVLTQLVFLG